jgi:hypothetical protein
LINCNDNKICVHSEKYVTAWQAGKALADGLSKVWEWQELVPKKDIRCMEDSEDVNQKDGGHVLVPQEGYRQMSWIWLGTDTTSNAGVEAGEFLLLCY